MEGRRIVDDQGRTVLLRGVNVNQLGDYFQVRPDIPPAIPLTRGDVERIAALTTQQWLFVFGVMLLLA